MASALVTVARMTFAPPSFMQFGRGILRFIVDVILRAQLPGQWLFVLAARDGNGFAAHLRGELYREMAQPADADHGDQIARPRAAIAKTIEGGDTRAHERRRIDGRKIIRHQRQRADRGQHVFGVAAIARDAGNFGGSLASEEIATPAVVAIAAESAIPAHTDPLSGLPARHAGANRVDYADYFVSRNARILDAGEKPSLVTVSLWQMPQAWTLIRTNPGPARGSRVRQFPRDRRGGGLARRAFLA